MHHLLYPLRDLFFAALARGRRSGQLWSGYWTDIGTPDQLAAVDARVGAMARSRLPSSS